MEAGNNPANGLPDNLLIYRLIKRGAVFAGPPERPQSSNFSDSSDGSGMSVFCADEIEAAGRDIRDLPNAIWPHENGVRIWALPYKVYKDLGESLQRKPIDAFPGHAEFKNPQRSSGTKTKLAKSASGIFIV